MNSFQIYALVRDKPIPITYFSCLKPDERHDIGATFNENLTESENSQYTLTFDMAKYYYESGEKKFNIYLPLLHMGGKIRLILDNNTTIDLIIKSITPSTISTEGTIYSYTAQDEFSYLLTRHRLGYSYSNEERGVENIYTIVNNVLKENFLSQQWFSYNNESQRRDIPIENSLFNKPITLVVENSNPYNVIIEACNTLNCYMLVDYATHSISFYQKELAPFSGYSYNPWRNLASFGVDYNIDEYASILHVTGGTNEYDEQISMVPAIPLLLQNYIEEHAHEWVNTNKFDSDWYIQLYNACAARYASYPDIWTPEIQQECYTFCQLATKIPHLGQFLYDFNFFHDVGYLSDNDMNEIDRLINTEMRKNNLFLRKLEPEQYKYHWQISQVEIELEQYASEYVAECQRLANQDTQPIIHPNDSEELKNIANKMRCTISNNWAYFLDIVHLDGDMPQPVWRNNQYELLTIEDLCYKDTTKKTIRYPSIYNFRKQSETYSTLYKQAEEEYNKINDLIVALETELVQNKTEEEKSILLEQFHTSSQYIDLDTQRTFYDQRRNTYKTLRQEGWDIINPTYHVSGLYEYILQNIITQWNIWIQSMRPINWPSSSAQGYNLQLVYDQNINTRVATYQLKNNNLWAELYRKYGQFIYEVQYENTDELDSVSLYNQAVMYFDAAKLPKANYNIEVIDISALERIDVPRLTVGSTIKIHHDEVKYLPESQQLLVVGLSYNLRMPNKISVTIEKINNYRVMVEKLLKLIK